MRQLKVISVEVRPTKNPPTKNPEAAASGSLMASFKRQALGAASSGGGNNWIDCVGLHQEGNPLTCESELYLGNLSCQTESGSPGSTAGVRPLDALLNADHKQQVNGDKRVIFKTDADQSTRRTLTQEFGMPNIKFAAVSAQHTKRLEWPFIANTLYFLNGHGRIVTKPLAP